MTRIAPQRYLYEGSVQCTRLFLCQIRMKNIEVAKSLCTYVRLFTHK